MIAAFSVTPLGIGEDVGEAVAAAVKVVRASGLPNRTDAMFTSVEGEWDEVMAVIKQAVEAVKPFANRVSTVIKIDDRVGVTDGLHTKLASLERHLAPEQHVTVD
ncbi:MTH1187 family thiamine-binding protein [Kitasatospora sp. NPDC052896]|uniref:MTH1187 family thiamine-binding protein n=1 Tax=Kitasatospora sp. NPDC052896 TaxID=3364061 RepID=UPI0037C72BC1